MLPSAERARARVGSDNWGQCDAIARSHGRTFYLASQFLPPARRRAALAAYAFCRIADDIVDSAPDHAPGSSATALAEWAAEIDAPMHPVAVAFAHARVQFEIPSRPVRDLLTGIGMDLSTNRYAAWPDLRTYCHLVAGTVGLIVAPIFGCRNPRALEHAATLGIAMQLTNILRDVAEDGARGRLYLPLDEIAAFGCDPDAILAARPGPRFPDLMAFQIERARGLYASSNTGLGALVPSGRLTTLAAGRLYAGILTEIETLGYDVFRTRARVAGHRKLRALPGVAAAFVRLSLFANPADAAGLAPRAQAQVPAHGGVEARTITGLRPIAAPLEPPRYG